MEGKLHRQNIDIWEQDIVPNQGNLSSCLYLGNSGFKAKKLQKCLYNFFLFGAFHKGKWQRNKFPFLYHQQPNLPPEQLRIIVGLHVSILSHFCHVQLSVTLWTAACQASLSMGFSRQEHWSGLPCPPPGDPPHPGIKPTSLISTCIGSLVLYHQHHLGIPRVVEIPNIFNGTFIVGVGYYFLPSIFPI